MADEGNQEPKQTKKKKRILSDTYTEEKDVSVFMAEKKDIPEKMHFVSSKDEEDLAKWNDYLRNQSNQEAPQQKDGNTQSFEGDVSGLDYDMYTQELSDSYGSEPTIVDSKPMNEGITENLEVKDPFSGKGERYSDLNCYDLMMYRDVNLQKTFSNKEDLQVKTFVNIQPDTRFSSEEDNDKKPKKDTKYKIKNEKDEQGFTQ